MTFAVAPMPIVFALNFTLSTSTKLALVIVSPLPPVCVTSVVGFSRVMSFFSVANPVIPSAPVTDALARVVKAFTLSVPLISVLQVPAAMVNLRAPAVPTSKSSVDYNFPVTLALAVPPAPVVASVMILAALLTPMLGPVNRTFSTSTYALLEIVSEVPV